MKVIRCKTVLSFRRYEIPPRQTVTAAVVLYLPNRQTPPFEYLNPPTTLVKQIEETCSPASFNCNFLAAISSVSAHSLSSCSFLFLSFTFSLSPLCDACSRFFCSILFSWPRFNVGTQSVLNLSQLFAAFPETKCQPHTRSFASICSDKSSRLIAEIHRDHLSFDNFSASSPWFVTNDGTREKWRPLPVSLVLLLPQSTIRQNTIFAWSMQAHLFTLLVHQ